jgi:hypothetical protein
MRREIAPDLDLVIVAGLERLRMLVAVASGRPRISRSSSRGLVSKHTDRRSSGV